MCWKRFEVGGGAPVALREFRRDVTDWTVAARTRNHIVRFRDFLFILGEQDEVDGSVQRSASHALDGSCQVFLDNCRGLQFLAIAIRDVLNVQADVLLGRFVPPHPLPFSRSRPLQLVRTGRNLGRCSASRRPRRSASSKRSRPRPPPQTRGPVITSSRWPSEV